MTAIVLAAGVGKRLHAASGGKPKCLIEIGGRSLLVRLLSGLAAAAALLRRGFTRLGLQCLLPAERHSNTITALRIPPGHTYATLHDGLKRRGFVIYEGQGKLREEVFRIANMGHLGRPDFERCLVALGEVLRA